MAKNRIDWKAIDNRILEALDLGREAESLGVRFSHSTPAASGWRQCHSAFREEANPSAAVCVAGSNGRLGQYTDLGDGEKTISFWELAVALQPSQFANWEAARKHFAELAGVELPKPASRKKKAGLRLDQLRFQDPPQPLLRSAVEDWAKAKPGVDVDAALAAGVRKGNWLGQFVVLAFPAFVPGRPDPVGWILYRQNGKDFPESPKNGLKQRKGHVLAGGRDGFVIVGKFESAETVWKCEGSTDALALAPHLPPGSVAVANIAGAHSAPRSLARALQGKAVRVVGDLDEAGQAGAKGFAALTAGVNEESDVRVVRLPGEIVEKHGADLRDFCLERGAETFERLEAIVEAAEPVAGDESNGVQEDDDDPHRLARVFLSGNARIRYWREEWYEYVGTHYQSIGKEDMEARINLAIKAEFDRIAIRKIETGSDEDATASKVSRRLVGNVFSAVKALSIVSTGIDQPCWLSDDGKPEKRSYIALKNGLFDVDGYLQDKEKDEVFLPHSEQWFSLAALPYDFDENAQSDHWEEKVVRKVFQDDDVIEFVQEWFGYHLLPGNSFQKFLFLIGEGENGKSVVCAALEAFIGKRNTSHVPLESFAERFALWPTLGKTAIIAPEVGEIDVKTEGRLKSYTGGDVMTVDRKSLTPVEAAPSAIITMAGNSMPRFHDRSRGLWRRMVPLPMEVTIQEHEKVNGMQRVEWWEDSGHLSAIFTWAIAGLSRLMERGHFEMPVRCKESLEKYRVENNPAREFLTDHYEQHSGGKLAKQYVYETYSIWCLKNGYRKLGNAAFGREVKRVFPGVDSNAKTEIKNGSVTRRLNAYEGITDKPLD